MISGLGLGLGLETSGLGLEALGLGLETPGLVNTPAVDPQTNPTDLGHVYRLLESTPTVAVNYDYSTRKLIFVCLINWFHSCVVQGTNMGDGRLSGEPSGFAGQRG